MDYLNRFLNNITMYKLVLYELVGLLLVASAGGAMAKLPYAPYMIGLSTAYIMGIAALTHWLFAWAYDASSNWESTYITALILALIISPPSSFTDVSYLVLATLATSTAIASKYLITWNGAHIFNPAAFGVAYTGIVLGLSASWWVATPILMPFALVGGALIVRKIRRIDLVLGFISGAMLVMLLSSSLSSDVLYRFFVLVPSIFFATVMLTEPITAPAERLFHVFYGVVIGVLFMPSIHFGSFYFTPETALLAGNLLVALVAARVKLQLTLKEVIPLAEHTYEFVFSRSRPFSFKAGQYVELTVPHPEGDARGIRRYFTIASSPTDPDLRFGIKFYEPSSTFKQKFRALVPGDTIVAGQLAGDFTLPNDATKKLAFIAGGIGITPFHSQLNYLRAKNEQRDIVLFYTNASPEKASYREDLEAARSIGLRIVYAYDGMGEHIPEGAVHSVNAKVIQEAAPDYKDRIFYISGPDRMVRDVRRMLRELHVPLHHIRTDYFPGFA